MPKAIVKKKKKKAVKMAPLWAGSLVTRERDED